MKIAVLDVAAERGGALSVLTDFLNFVRTSQAAKKQEWFIFTGIDVAADAPHIHIIADKTIKKSWLHRLYWEKYRAKKLLNRYRIDTIISLQNTAIKKVKIPQLVYFHNVLLLEPADSASLWNAEERTHALYTRLVAPYTLKSLKQSDLVIAQTKTVAEQLRRILGAVPVQVIYPSIQLPPVPDPTSRKRIKGLIYPAAAVPFKHQLELVEAVKRTPAILNSAFELLLTFRGDENAYARRVFQAARGVKNIRFVGYLPREEVLNRYQTHGLLMVSALESFPIPLVEAMHYGSPILAYDLRYAREVLGDYKNCVLCSPTAAALAGALPCCLKLEVDCNRRRGVEGGSWEQLLTLAQGNRTN